MSEDEKSLRLLDEQLPELDPNIVEQIKAQEALQQKAAHRLPEIEKIKGEEEGEPGKIRVSGAEYDQLQCWLLFQRRSRCMFDESGKSEDPIVMCGSSDAINPVPKEMAEKYGFSYPQPGPCIQTETGPGCRYQSWAYARSRGARKPFCTLNVSVMVVLSDTDETWYSLAKLNGRRTSYTTVNQALVTAAQIDPNHRGRRVGFTLSVRTDAYMSTPYAVWKLTKPQLVERPGWLEAITPAQITAGLEQLYAAYWTGEEKALPPAWTEIDEEDMPF